MVFIAIIARFSNWQQSSNDKILSIDYLVAKEVLDRIVKCTISSFADRFDVILRFWADL